MNTIDRYLSGYAMTIPQFNIMAQTRAWKRYAAQRNIENAQALHRLGVTAGQFWADTKGR